MFLIDAMRSFKNRAQSNIVKRDREPMFLSKALDLLLALARRDCVRPDPGELRIVNRTDFLVSEFGFDPAGKLVHMSRSENVT